MVRRVSAPSATALQDCARGGAASQNQKILFPVLTVSLLGFIWGITLNLIRTERVNAARTSAAATLELLDTYEAQIVRALREIDQTLKLLKCGPSTGCR
jgi:hypothetical protein